MKKKKAKKIYAYVFTFLMICSLFTSFLNFSNIKSSSNIYFTLQYDENNKYGPYNKIIVGENIIDVLKNFVNSYNYENETIICIYNVCNTNDTQWKIYVNNKLENTSYKIKNDDVILIKYERNKNEI